MRHDVFDYTRWVDTGSWATDLPVSLGASVSNIAAYMFNSAVNILALPEDVARALGMSDQEIHELNFVLLMTGLTEARMAAQSIRTGPAWLIGRLKLLTTTSRLRAGYVTATPEFSARVWRLIPFIRGQLIELILRLTQYAKWTHIGAWDRGFWPLIDFQRGRSVVSLKTIDPWTKTYDDRLLKLASHADELANATITVDGVAVTERILDIRVPQGTGATVIAEMVDTILEVAEGVTIAISEF
ncbi:MAG: hypothetical protein M5T61_18870 [Acidimicrobiia bacterium]|nr:hypothetical protein [Acidimicrobiia bacterium]